MSRRRSCRETLSRLVGIGLLLCWFFATAALVSCGGVSKSNNNNPGTPSGPTGGGTPGGGGGSGGSGSGGTGGSGGSGGSGGGSGSGGSGGGSGGGGGTPSATSTFVYVVDLAPSAIETYKLDPSTGTLTAAGAPVAVGHNLGSLAVSPNGKFGYGVANDFVNNTFSSVLLGFAFDPTSGLPALKQTLPVAGPIGGWSAVDPSGRFLFVSIDSNASTGSGIASYAIQNDGSLVQNGAIAPTDPNPGRIAVDPKSRFLYTDTSSTNKVWGYTINSTTGTLTPIPNTPFTIIRTVPEAGKEPQDFNEVIDPAGQRLFCVDNINSRVNVFTIDQTTGGIALQGSTTSSPFAELFAPAMDPKGRFLYVGEFNANQIVGFSIANSSSATLPTIPGLPVTTSGAPNRRMVVDPTGSFAYSIETDGIGSIGNLDGYKIDQTTGALTRLPAIKLQGSPVWIEVGP